MCVVLAGGSRLLRNGLKLMLTEIGAEIVGDYSTVQEIKKGETRGEQQVVYLLKHSGPEEIRQNISDLRRIDPGARIVIMLSRLAADELLEVFAAGGDGLLLEDIGASALYESLKLIEIGEKVFPSQLATLLNGERLLANSVLGVGAGVPLTNRESEILRCLTAGMSNKEIAKKLDLAVATVKVHVKSLLKKLKLSNRTQAAIWAVDAGLAGPPPVFLETDGRTGSHPSRGRGRSKFHSEILGNGLEEKRTLPGR